MEALFLHCTSAFSQHGGLYAVFFLGGLMGGLTHCLAMCGSLVASQTIAGACAKPCSKGSCATPRMTELKTMPWLQALQIPYHLGRMVSYGLLGFFAAYFSQQISEKPYWAWLSSFLLCVAGFMFLASSLPLCRHLKLLQFLQTKSSRFFRGLALGAMPCGLIYAALMMAATLANPLSGMFAMWIFVLGTIPALFVAGMGAGFLTQKWQRAMQYVGRAMMAFNGLSLLVMAGKSVR
jgi:sulfite exporter TauE/SafE